MAPATSTKLTYEDYCLLPDDGRRHEIIDGEHYVNPSPNTGHQRISKRFVEALLPFEHRGLGEVFYAPYDVLLSISDVVEPDVLWITADRSHIITLKNIVGPPDVVIEVLSDSNRNYDRVVKYKTYERWGVAEYWIADPDAETVSIFRRASGAFISVETGDAVTTPLIPGFHLSLREIFS